MSQLDRERKYRRFIETEQARKRQREKDGARLKLMNWIVYGFCVYPPHPCSAIMFSMYRHLDPRVTHTLYCFPTILRE